MSQEFEIRRAGAAATRLCLAAAIAMFGLFVPRASSAQQARTGPAASQEVASIGAMDERIPAGQIISEADVLSAQDVDGAPISINFVNTDIRDVATFFSNLTGLNVLLDPDVNGPVTVSFYDVPWDEALEAILQSHRFGYQVLQQNIVRVSSLSRLAEEAEERARLVAQEDLAAPLETTSLRLSYAKADALVAIIEPQLSPRGELMVDTRTNSMIIRDTAPTIAAVSGLVETLDVAAPQVLIESRIVETTKEFSRELGIQWGFSSIADAAHGNTTGLVFPNNVQVQGLNSPVGSDQSNPANQSVGIGGVPFAVNLPSQNATSGVGLTMGSILDTFRLDMALSAMEEEGRGKIISSPKVTAQDNTEASIQSGRRIPVQTLVDNTVSITFINANLQLQVTPQITADGTVMLDILVDKSEPDFGNSVLGIPTIFTRRAETKLLVRDGGTTVIGGIFQMSVSEQERRVPFFHRIPLLGSLFKSKETAQTNNELLIFITPRILEQ